MASPVSRFIPTRCYDDGHCDEYEGPEEEDLDTIRALEEDLEAIWQCSTIGRDMLEEAEACARHLLTVVERVRLRVPEIIQRHTAARALLTSLLIWRRTPAPALRADLQHCLDQMPPEWASIPLCDSVRTMLA
jgi:hypothetical protein